jgi:hypothetical protein
VLAASLSRFQQDLRMASCDVKQLERCIGRCPGVGLPGLDGSGADVEQSGEGDLGDSKASPDLGHIAGSELWQRTEFDFARRQRSLPAVVRDRVLESSAQLGERRSLPRIRTLLHDASSFSLRTIYYYVVETDATRAVLKELPPIARGTSVTLRLAGVSHLTP